LNGPTTGSSSQSQASPTVTTESVNGKKNTLRSSARSRPRLSATARARGMARIGRVLAMV
jgi:hypothetical protein